VHRIEEWYRHHVDAFVQEGRARASDVPGQMGEIDGGVLAYAHELAWRQAIVRAAKSSTPADWTALTVAHEAAAYEHLLGWVAIEYHVSETDVRSHQTTRGYRHHQR
jgi:hypothetical protein